MSQAAVKRFQDSMPMDYDRWREGEGLDLDSLREMTPDEIEQVRALLKTTQISWRELEAIAVIDSLAGTNELQSWLTDPQSADNRIKTANLLFEYKKIDQAAYETILCKAIRDLGTHDSTTTRILLYAQELTTEKVKQALLWSSWNRTDASFHCAARLIYLCGKTKDPLAFKHRPLLFDLQPNNNSFTRQAAFKKLCELVKMELDTEQWP